MGFNPTKQEVDELNWNNNMKVPREFGESNPTFDYDDYVKPSEKQVGGSHYKDYAIQPWDIIDCYGLDFYEGNVLKYLLRTKGARVEDLQKAKHYLDKIIEGYEA
jgi:hypothetical protein